jgi:transcriptional regulator with XRE-family HTH domain
MARVSLLRKYREERGETAEDVAKRLDVTAAYVRMIEAGKRPLRFEETRKPVAERGYLLPLDVFDLLRRRGISVEKALKKSMDRRVNHDATDSCTAGAA